MELKEFMAVVLPFGDKMHRLARRMLHNAEEAEDTVQDVYLVLWKMRLELETYRSVEALAMRIVRNKCLDKLKSKRNGMLDINHHSQSLTSALVAPDQKLEYNNSMDLMSRAMGQLPEKQQILIQLRDIEEFEFEEIAEITGFDLNYMRVNLSRARKKIRDFIQKAHEYGL